MINLLPEESKAAVRTLYRGRLALVSLFALLVLVILSIGLLMPTLIALSSRSATASRSLELAEARPVSREADDVAAEIKVVNSKLSRLSSLGEPEKAGEALEKLLQYASAGIGLTSFNYKNDGSIEIHGLAENREKLLTFIRALEAEPYFSSVASPISNLIESADIDFAITLVVAKPSDAKTDTSTDI